MHGWLDLMIQLLNSILFLKKSHEMPRCMFNVWRIDDMSFKFSASTLRCIPRRSSRIVKDESSYFQHESWKNLQNKNTWNIHIPHRSVQMNIMCLLKFYIPSTHCLIASWSSPFTKFPIPDDKRRSKRMKRISYFWEWIPVFVLFHSINVSTYFFSIKILLHTPSPNPTT